MKTIEEKLELVYTAMINHQLQVEPHKAEWITRMYDIRNYFDAKIKPQWHGHIDDLYHKINTDRLTSINTGGDVWVDMLHLGDGTAIGITPEEITLYRGDSPDADNAIDSIIISEYGNDVPPPQETTDGFIYVSYFIKDQKMLRSAYGDRVVVGDKVVLFNGIEIHIFPNGIEVNFLHMGLGVIDRKSELDRLYIKSTESFYMPTGLNIDKVYLNNDDRLEINSEQVTLFDGDSHSVIGMIDLSNYGDNTKEPHEEIEVEHLFIEEIYRGESVIDGKRQTGEYIRLCNDIEIRIFEDRIKCVEINATSLETIGTINRIPAISIADGERYASIIELFEELGKCMYDLSKEISELEDGDRLNATIKHGYPFTGSFDDVSLNVQEWTQATIQRLHNLAL